MNKWFNNKLLNAVLILIIIYLVYLLKDAWLPIYHKLIMALSPFVIAFVIAYVLYPFLKWFQRRKVPKWLGVLIILIVIITTTSLTLYYLVPLLIKQLIQLASSLSIFVSEITKKYNLDFLNIDSKLGIYVDKLTSSFSDYIMTGSFIKLITSSVSYITNTVIILIVSIYMLYDMDNFRKWIKDQIKNNKTYNLLKTFDKEIYLYLKGMGTVMIIQFFEYSLAFLLIGHPNFLFIGFLASVTTVIPYIGGFLTNIFAIIIASVISTDLLILTIILSVVLPNIDGYLISPKIYKKTNRISPLLTIFAVFTCGIFWGFLGIVISIPLTIIIISTYKMYKTEISEKIFYKKEKNNN